MRMRQSVYTAMIAALIVSNAGTVGAQAPPADSVKGSFTVNGKTYTLTHAAAFVDASDSRKPVILILTDKALPAKALTTGSALSLERNTNPFNGIGLWLDDKQTVFRAEYYENGWTTATSGVFALKLSSKPGKTLAGTIQTGSAAKVLKDTPTSNVTFSATLK
jgi:hypothetical protein